MIEVFNLISQLKNISKEKLVVSYEEQKSIYNIWRSNKVLRRKFSQSKFRDMVIGNRIEKTISIEDSILYTIKEIYTNGGFNSNI